MRKCTIMILLLLFLPGCSFGLTYAAQYEFYQDFEQIEKIEIVIHEYDKSLLEPMEPVKVLDPTECKTLIDGLLKMDGGFNHMNPSSLFGDYLVRITYRNGAVEIIGDWISGYIDLSGELHINDYMFNTEQYCALLSSILEELVTHPKPK